MTEIWKPVKGFEGLYEVSNFGNVKTLEKELNVSHRGYTGVRIAKSKIMKIYKYGKYYGIPLRKDKKYYQKWVHRLVAEAFIPNPNNYSFVNHKDENPSNNNVENLEWCTPKYNCNYGERNKKISQKRIGMKFTEEHIEHIKQAKKQAVTDEFREKMRQVHLGKHLTEEHKKKIGQGVKQAFNKKII